MTEVKTTISNITPKQAAIMLQRNPMNRTIRRMKVDEIARDILAGRWQFNGDAIRFNDEGDLIDGQTRLTACVKSGMSIKTIILRGLPDSVRTTIDSGSKRTIGQRFQMLGIAQANVMAGAIAVMHAMAQGMVKSTVTPGEADEIMELHPGIVRSVSYGYRAFPALGSRLSALHYIGTYLGRGGDADQFIEVWQTGIPSYDGDAAHVAREKLLKTRGTTAAIRFDFVARIVTHSFNLFMDRRSVRGIKVPDVMQIRGWNMEALYSPCFTQPPSSGSPG